MKFELKDLIVIGGVLVSITIAFATLRSDAQHLDQRLQKIEKLELAELHGRVDRMSCKIAQLRKQLLDQPTVDCPD